MIFYSIRGMKSGLKRAYKRLTAPIRRQLESVVAEVQANRILLAQSRIQQLQRQRLERIRDAEFRVFSQWGEDGIIQYLISRIPVENEVFVEFGVETYDEANTRFLLVNNNWSGLVIDADSESIEKIRSMSLYWRHDLTAVQGFVTENNINALIRDQGIEGDIGLLSIDIDGNDYWIWRAIEVISPRIVVIEYNSLFGCRHAVTVPYQEAFSRMRAHHSGLYFGASLKALCRLADEKGYVFVGTNSAGVNAFFVREDVAGNVHSLNCEEGYVESKVRESRDRAGKLTYVGGAKRLQLIQNMEVWDVQAGQLRRVGDLL